MSNPNPDRKTGIDADQISDYTLTPFELDTENFPEDFVGEIVLTVNPDTGNLRYLRKEIVGSVADHFQFDENGDIEAITIPIFVNNDAGDVTLTEDGIEDFFFEVIDNQITPKE